MLTTILAIGGGGAVFGLAWLIHQACTEPYGHEDAHGSFVIGMPGGQPGREIGAEIVQFDDARRAREAA